MPRTGWAFLVLLLVAAGLVIAVASNWAILAGQRHSLQQALWVLPGLVGLHLTQLLLSAIGWRALFEDAGPGIGTFHRLRILREGIDSLLPVAQVGGEIVGARLLSQCGIPPSQAGASVLVDVTIELLTQVAFLVAGLCALAWLSPAGTWRAWGTALLTAAGVAAALVAAQRFGLLRMLEGLLRGIARRWPAIAGASLDGIQVAALEFYRRPAPLLISGALHLMAWMLGSIETYVVLNVMGVPVTPLQAFTIESLGMAARSAGFAIPGALGAQEGGFVLAAVALGLPAGPALALSLTKRIREVCVGLIGLALWQRAVRRAPA